MPFLFYVLRYWMSVVMLCSGVTSPSMTKPCSLGLIPRMLEIGAWGWPYTIVFSMGLDRGNLVLGLQKCICTITISETGAYMLFVLVWNPRWFEFGIAHFKTSLIWMMHQVNVFCQIFSQHNIYEAGQKKVAFKYLTEKVCLVLFFNAKWFLSWFENHILSEMF